jgi:hypothetical protein
MRVKVTTPKPGIPIYFGDGFTEIRWGLQATFPGASNQHSVIIRPSFKTPLLVQLDDLDRAHAASDG